MSEFFVSPAGDNHGDGTSQHPYATITFAATKLHPGDVLTLMTGTYYEHVKLDGVGTEDADPITIAPQPGHRVAIDGARREFIEDPGHMWEPLPSTPTTPGVAPAAAGLPGPETTPPFAVQEFRSIAVLPHGTERGAFTVGGQLGRKSFTKLVTYDERRDLLALNERFGKLPRGLNFPPGPMIEGGAPPLATPPTRKQRLPRRPWVYMGPGLWHDGQTAGQSGHLHVRLSHTTLDDPGVVNYTGETDPRKLPLAIWGADTEGPALEIRNCHGLRIRNITVQHARQTVLVAQSGDISLDHLVVNAGGQGITLGENCDHTTITNTVVDGGLPTWFFRSDRKDDYDLANGTHNALGKRTLNTLMSADATADRTHIEQCEFVNGHDVQLNGANVTFTRNWIRNINDDAIFVGEVATDMRIVGNVIEQVIKAVAIFVDSDVGPVYVHRNLIDLRLPTLGRRPHPNPALMASPDLDIDKDDRDVRVLRFGNLLKARGADPPLFLSHNTVVVVDQEIFSNHNVFREYTGTSVRRAYNNIFLAINRTEASDKPVAFLPKPQDKAETNGNCYFRIGRHSSPMFQVRETPRTFADLEDLRDIDDPANGYYRDVLEEHNPGYEASSIDTNPRLRRYWPPFELPGVEDLRLADKSPAIGHGINLTGLLPADLVEPHRGAGPDIGCYPVDSPPMRVGVEGRREFPTSGLVTPLPPLGIDG
jgi:parallel beta helix pectate lyase-like protein